MIDIETFAAKQMHFPGIVAIRTCTGCGQGKSLTVANFYCHKSNRAGFDTRCRNCRNATRRKWRAENADRINARRREIYAVKKLNPIPMDRSTTDTGVGKHAGTSTAEPDGPSTGQAGGPSTPSNYDFPDIPDFLRVVKAVT